MDVSFGVTSSDGNTTYRVSFQLSNKTVTVTCDCAAGVLGKLCRHKLALLVGKANEVADNSEREEYSKIQGVLTNNELGNLAKEIDALEKTIAETKSALERAKKRLERAMLGRA